VSRYWHELETGLLPVSGISEQLRKALRERFGEAADAAVGWRRAALKQPPIGLRRGMLLEQRAADVPPAVAADLAAKLEGDEVDELFGASGRSR
jgi:hypothetical protein